MQRISVHRVYFGIASCCAHEVLYICLPVCALNQVDIPPPIKDPHKHTHPT